MSEIDNMRIASYLLPDPGGEVVRNLLDKLDALHAEVERLKTTQRKLAGLKVDIESILEMNMQMAEQLYGRDDDGGVPIPQIVSHVKSVLDDICTATNAAAIKEASDGKA